MWTDCGAHSITSSQPHKELTQELRMTKLKELKDDWETRHIYIYIYFSNKKKQKQKTEVYLELSK